MFAIERESKKSWIKKRTGESFNPPVLARVRPRCGKRRQWFSAVSCRALLFLGRPNLNGQCLGLPVEGHLRLPVDIVANFDVGQLD